MPWLCPAVFFSEICDGGVSVGSHIFDPLGSFLYSTAAQIDGNIRFTVKLIAQLHKLMCAKAVVFYGAAPAGIYHTAAVLLGTDTVPPVVFVGKAAARPAENRQMQRPEGFHNVLAHSFYIRNIRIFSHIDAIVNTASQMLRKLSIDFRSDVA